MNPLTHPRPLPGGEQTVVRPAKVPLPRGEQTVVRPAEVPLLGGVRGGFIVPMRANIGGDRQTCSQEGLRYGLDCDRKAQPPSPEHPTPGWIPQTEVICCAPGETFSTPPPFSRRSPAPSRCPPPKPAAAGARSRIF